MNRILTPSEYEALRDNIPRTRLRIIIDLLLFSGMRYSELLRFSKDTSMFDAKNRAISLPPEATKTNKGRVIHLTPAFSKQLDQHLREFKILEVPTRRSMDYNLKRWWFFSSVNCDPNLFCGWYISTKTFRKTWESWLLAAGYPSMAIALSQGHSELIAYKYYATLDPRLKSEMDKVRDYTKGWGL